MEIIAHRGASFDAPENSLAAVRLAWRQKADAVEVDIMQSLDGRMVVFHDRDTLRLSGKKLLVSRTPFQKLRRLDVGSWKGEKWNFEKIPSLTELLDQQPRGKKVVLEIKAGRKCLPALCRALKGHDPVEKPLVFISFSFALLRDLKRRLPNFPMFWILDSPKTGSFQPAEVSRRVSHGNLDGVDLSAQIPLPAPVVKQFHQRGLKVLVWTVDDPVQARKLIKAGVDGLTTNRPGWMRRQLQGRLTGRRKTLPRKGSATASLPCRLAGSIRRCRARTRLQPITAGRLPRRYLFRQFVGPMPPS